MSYIAIARKWRPQTFEEVAGQSHITKTLRNAIERDRIHHAYLFSGPRGVGKTTCARALARSINCAEGPTSEPCGVCVNCRDILKGTSPDVVEIDGASNNSVDNVRELRESVQYMPVNGRKRVYIIDEVHMLSKAAFNALLKTLEEPPAHIMFIFATTEPNKLPDTILSRVQRFEFKRIPTDIVVERLKLICASEQISIDDGGLRLIARAGEGSMRDSQSLLDQVISFGGENITTNDVAQALGLVDRALLYKMLRGVIEQSPENCFEAIEGVYNAGYDLSEFSAEMLEILRNATLVVLSPKSHRFVDIPEDERKLLFSLAKESTADVFTRSFQVMLDVHEQVSRSPKPKLALEMSVARLLSIRPARPIDELIERINRMEGGGSPRKKAVKSTKRSVDKDDEEPPPAAAAQRAPQATIVAPVPVKAKAAAPVSNKPHVAATTTSPPPSNSKSPPKVSAPDAIKPSPPVHQEQQDIERFERFRQYLLQKGIPAEHFTDEIAIHSISNEVLNLVCDNEFQLLRIRKLKTSPVLLEAIQSLYSAKQFQIRIRKKDEHLEIYKERVLRLKKERRQRIQEHLEQDPIFSLLNESLDVTITQVFLPEDRSQST